MAKRRQRGEETQVDRAAATLRGTHELGKGYPIPGDALGQRGVRNRFDVGQVPRRDFAIIGLAGCHTDAAISHHDAGHAVPGGAADHRIPADLRIVMGVRIDESRRDDQFRCVDLALAAFGDLADFDDAIAVDCNVAAKPRGAGPIDDRAVLDYQIIRHSSSPIRGFAPVSPAYACERPAEFAVSSNQYDRASPRCRR